MSSSMNIPTLKSLGNSGPLPVHRLGDKVVLITGGGGKIAVETARRLLREGANVSLVDIDGDALKAAVDVLRGTLATGQGVTSRILTTVADATNESEVERFVNITARTFGRLDCAFLNAGISYESSSIFDSKEEDYKRVMDLNVKTAFLGVKHAAAAMRDFKNGGSIILTSSIEGLRGTPGHVLESLSKASLTGLALTAAGELGQYGIRVNTINPSGLHETMAQNIETPEELEQRKNDIPLGRFARADDVASVVAFLASEDSKFMSGGHLKIDGGCIASC